MAIYGIPLTIETPGATYQIRSYLEPEKMEVSKVEGNVEETYVITRGRDEHVKATAGELLETKSDFKAESAEVENEINELEGEVVDWFEMICTMLSDGQLVLSDQERERFELYYQKLQIIAENKKEEPGFFQRSIWPGSR